MHLFTTQLNDIQTQIEALQAERNRLQDLENAAAGALANLKAIVANIEGDALAIATLKNAVSDLFQSDPDAEEAVDENDEDGEDQSQAETVTVVDKSDKPEEKATPKFKKMFDGEPEPDDDDFDVVIYNDRVHRYENTLGIHFKLKREAKAWASQFEAKYHDCKIEIHKDDFESFGYVLKMTKGNPNDPQWWQEVSSYDYSKSPEENRKPAVQQTLPHIELDEKAVNSEFTFIATGMGWQKVIHNGEVLGPIYSNQSGWELENGDVFSTREEAATALFNSTPSAA